MQNFLSKLVPFLLLGIMIVILIVGIVLLWYLLVYGAIIGLILFAGAWIKDRFFSTKRSAEVEKPGRTLDHDDFK